MAAKNIDEIFFSTFYEHVREAAAQTGKSIDEILKTIRKAGIRGLEVEYRGQKDLEEILAGALKNDIEVASVYQFLELGTDYEGSLKKGRDMMDDLSKKGIKRAMIIPGFLTKEQSRSLNKLSDSYEKTAEYMENLPETALMAKGLINLTEYAGEKGITVSLEDFDGFTSPIARANQLKWFFTKVSNLKHTFDMGNYAFSNENAEAALEEFKDIICHVHCKDRGEEVETDKSIREDVCIADGLEMKYRRGMKPVPVGEGYIPIAKMLKVLIKRGYKGYLALEHFGAGDQLDFMVRSAGNVTRILSEL